MSVIFKTLKKLKSQSPEDRKEAGKLKRFHNVYSFRRILFSPLAILVLVLFIFLSGLVTIYIAGHLTGKSKRLPTVSEERKEHQAVTARELTETSARGDVIQKEPAPAPVPSSQKDFSVEETKKVKLYLPESQKSRIARHTTPVSPKRAENASLKKPPTPGDTETIHVLPAHVPPVKDKFTPAATSDISRDNKAMIPEKIPYFLTSRSLPTKKKPLEKMPEEIQSSEEAKKKSDKHLHLVKVEKNAKITSLVKEIQKSMTADSNTQTEKLLDQLTRLKGEKDSYVLKLRAFYHMRQGNYNLAASLLNKVLQKNKNDLEAGVNMAILEIKTGQLTEAKNRLSRLRDVYPHNIRIPELIQKLK
ncbi:MAG: tetratricopeptide repeat protein [Thermodesulfobacteriota bacterium]|nr:tetratricopeptide repeat protein [Thermodesulfobacteriota bacterium]